MDFIAKWWTDLFYIQDYGERYVLITGCDTGFGNALAKQLDKMGVPVFACCLTQGGIKELQAECSETLVAMTMNVTDEKSIQTCLDTVKKTLGESDSTKSAYLWGLVNNAGIGGQGGVLEMLKIHHIEEVMNVNLYGMIRVTQAFLPLLRRSQGRIINISSMEGRMATLSVPYITSKFAVEGYSDRLRRELYHTGVKLHIIEPGFFKTHIFNSEKILKDHQMLYDEADEEVQAYYGSEFIETVSKHLCKLPEILAPNLQPVVDACTHALFSKVPKYRYVVGPMARSAAFISKLPEWLQDYLVCRMSEYIPAGCRKGGRGES